MTIPVLDLARYFPFYLGTISNRWTATSSKTYREEFGIGIADWRVLASIHAQGAASSQMVVNLIFMDAGAVSRSIARLVAAGYVNAVPGKFVGRTKPYRLTEKGRELYAKLVEIALNREERLLALLNTDERDTLLILMRKIVDRLETL